MHIRSANQTKIVASRTAEKNAFRGEEIKAEKRRPVFSDEIEADANFVNLWNESRERRFSSITWELFLICSTEIKLHTGRFPHPITS